MKYSIILFFSILSFLTACSKEKVSTCEDCNFTCLDENEPSVYTNECNQDWTCSFKVMEQSQISVEEPAGIASGDKTVFQMIRSTEGSPDIADDEYTEILVIELDSEEDSFSVEANELSTVSVYLKQVCFCPEVRFKRIVDRCVQGEKQEDGTWFLQGFFRGDFEFGLEAKFE